MEKFLNKGLCLLLIFALLSLTGCGPHTKDDVSDIGAFLSSSMVEEIVSSDIEQEEISSLIESEVSTTSITSTTTGTASKKPSSSKNNKTPSKTSSSTPSKATATSSEVKPVKKPPVSADQLLIGIWISYYELPFKNKTEETATAAFDEMLQKISNQGYNAIFCHVRANADAFYPSSYFPYAKQLTGTQGKDPGYDPLKVMINCAKKYGLEIHAWINPYRVTTASSDPTLLSSNNIAAKWATDGSNRAVQYGNGIYFNPASTDVQNLVINGIREILNNYDVDGIHFDDYFYPSKADKKFDAKEYDEYCKSSKSPLKLDDWRRANVNALISQVYRLCKSKNTTFGISPAGNVSLDNSHRNYTDLYADVSLWMAQSGYIDYVIPQLYFGYNHPLEKSRYKYLLDTWMLLERHSGLKVYIGLGAYKMDENCDDKEEWHKENDLLARQVTDARKAGTDGVVVFSYGASTQNDEFNKAQMQNMFNALKKK